MAEVNPTNPTDISSFSLEGWRKKFIGVILIWASLFGFLALITTIFNSNGLINKAIFVSTYAILLLLTFIRLPYTLRAGAFVLIIYILGLSGLFETGVRGDALLFLLAFIVMSGLLFSTRTVIYTLVLSTVSITILGFLILNGFYLPPTQGMATGTLGDWLSAGASLLLLGTIATVGLYFFQTEFVHAQGRFSETFKTLRTEQENLEKRVVERTDELEKRNSSLRSTVYLIRQIAEFQDLSAIPPKTVDLITQSFGHYQVSLFLLSEGGKTAILQASSSDAGQKKVESGHSVVVGDRSLVGRVAEQAKLIISSHNLNIPGTDAGELDMPGTHSEIALPLIARGKVLGVLDIQSEQLQAFDQSEPEILQLLTDQVAISIDNARLLSGAGATVSQSELVTAQQTKSIWRETLINQNLSYQFTPLGIKSIPPRTTPQDLNSLHVPLILRGQEIGTISLQRKDKAEWTEPDQELVKKIAIQVALALDNIRLIEETRQHAVQEQTVNEISARFSRSLDVDTLLQTAVRELASLPDVSEASVFIKPSDENKLRIN